MSDKERRKMITLSAEEYLRRIQIKKKTDKTESIWCLSNKKNPAGMPGNSRY